MMKRELLSILAVATWFVAPHAKAHDSSLQPGHDCRYYGRQANDSYFSPSGTNANGLTNTATVAKVAVCAINKDPELDTSSAWISFSGPTEDCAMYWRHPDGTSWGSWSNNLGIGNNPRINSWSLTYDTSDKVVSLYCSVSPGITINSFQHNHL